MYTLAIVEDNPTIREQLLHHFATSNAIECLFSTDNTDRLLKYNFREQKVDIILLDISLPFKSGIDALPAICKKFTDSEIIMYTVLDDNDKIFQALCNGATGYLLKNQTPSELEQQLLAALHEGGSPISPQIARRIIKYFNPKQEVSENLSPLNEMESKIIHFLKEALTYAEIATNLNLTIHGVRYHIMNIYKKLQVKSRQQAINKFDSFFNK